MNYKKLESGFLFAIIRFFNLLRKSTLILIKSGKPIISLQYKSKTKDKLINSKEILFLTNS